MASPSQSPGTSSLRAVPSLASLRRPGTPQPASPLSASVDTTPVIAEPGEIKAGRALTVGRKARDEWISGGQEKAMSTDPKYRKYAALVDRALVTIEDAHEWADLITFLAKLLKTLQSQPSYPFVPHKHTVAKRLSQCLNPALPQGVHQRALEVYAHVLTTIGPDGLRRDLQIWSAGLFPFFQYAATTVRPIVLGIYERFYLPLQEDLRPSIKAFILALLPGLEEETSEHFDKVCSLLDRLSGTVSPSFFLQNLWLVLVTSSGTGYRIPALNYLSRRMPRLDGSERLGEIVGDDVGLMVRGFAASLEDDNILVQRGVLDLLLSTLRLDSVGFKEDTRPEDRLLLMRAAIGVVLRRDISLSRRLYNWLLGPSEEPTEQSTYLRLHGLPLLRSALLADMDLDDDEAISDDDAEADLAARQRGFKIFIALLDKWEIAEQVIDSCVLEVLAAIRRGLRPPSPPSAPISAAMARSASRESAVVASKDSAKSKGKEVAAVTSETTSGKGDELLLTANMLFDALDPFTAFRKFFHAVQDAMSRGSEENLDLLQFAVMTFRIHDEELLKLHVPLLVFALIDILSSAIDPTAGASSASGVSPKVTTALLVAAVDLVIALLQSLPYRFFESDGSLQLSSSAPVGPSNFDLTKRFYEASDIKEAGALLTAGGTFAGPRMTSLAVSKLLGTLETELAEGQPKGELDEGRAALWAKLAEVVELLLAGARGVESKLVLDWEPSKWLHAALRRVQILPTTPSGFEVTERLLGVMLALSEAEAVSPPLQLDDRQSLGIAVSTLLDFLQGSSAPFYVQAVHLVWRLQQLTRHRHIEAIVAARLASKDPQVKRAAFESFGNLWRYTDDSLLPGSRLRIPMLLVLDSLRDDDLSARRYGEAWMRCNLKSYLRVLDPLFTTLLDPRIRRRPVTLNIADREIFIQEYVAPFDDAIVEHAFENLLSLARFGGQGFTRIAKGCQLKSTLDPALKDVLGLDLEAATYLDGLITLLLRFLLSDPSPTLLPAMVNVNQRIHAVTGDLLQIVISRGELPTSELQAIENALVNRLAVCIHRQELDLQNKLLHVLHAVIAALAVVPERRRSASVTSKDGAVAATASEKEAFVRVVADGITRQGNSAVVHHWIDFLLMTVPHFRRSLTDLIEPLVDRLTSRAQDLVFQLRLSYAPATPRAALGSGVTDADFAVVINALERLLIVAVDEGAANPEAEDEAKLIKSPASDGAGFLGGIGGVFGVLGSSDLPASQPAEQKRKPAFQQRLERAITMLLDAWDLSKRFEDDQHSDTDDSRGYFTSRIRLRTRKSFEKLYRALPGETLESIVDYWNQRCRSSSPASVSTENHLFQLIDQLAPSAQAVVAMIYDRLAARGHLAATDRGKATAATSFISETVLFQFLELYISRLEGPIAVQVWNPSLTFCRDVIGNPTSTKGQVFPTLKCFTELCDKISHTPALEDRRMRRDLHDTFVKLCDGSIQGVGRYTEGASWRRNGKTETNGDTASIASDKEGEAAAPDGPSEKALPVPVSDYGPTSGEEVAQFLTERALPGCRRYMLEVDKVAAIGTNIMYYIIAPAFKGRSRSFDVDPLLLDLLLEMTRHQAALKSWRGQVADAFADNRFFNMTPEGGARWKSLVQALMLSDKERFTDMLSKISTAPSANIFTNRELEMLSRSFSLRRISYVIFSGDHNRYLLHLPAIQEKVVDLLRSHVGEIVHAEVYLCMRVLLCRMGNQHLAGFWPVILTELTRLFEGLAESLPDSPHFLALVLAASKFLDLLLTLQTEDFQIHQWMFITDTVDAIYPPDQWSPAALLDRLSLVLGVGGGDVPSPRVSPEAARGSFLSLPGGKRVGKKGGRGSGGRKPLLSGVRRIDDAGPLEKWFTKVSWANYEALYRGGGIDWRAVEEGLEADLFDG